MTLCNNYETDLQTSKNWTETLPQNSCNKIKITKNLFFLFNNHFKNMNKISENIQQIIE